MILRKLVSIVINLKVTSFIIDAQNFGFYYYESQRFSLLMKCARVVDSKHVIWSFDYLFIGSNP